MPASRAMRKAWRHSWGQRWPTRIQRGGPLRSPPAASPGIGRRARASGWAASPPPPRRVRHRPLGVALRSPASQHHHRVMTTRCRIPTMDACFVSTHRGGAGTRSTGHGWPAPPSGRLAHAVAARHLVCWPRRRHVSIRATTPTGTWTADPASTSWSQSSAPTVAGSITRRRMSASRPASRASGPVRREREPMRAPEHRRNCP
jgi:hypothetical protein